tara:strand:- start:515 stop:742 length:228 start_codon:yes stop_codon:yes gene_type:complete
MANQIDKNDFLTTEQLENDNLGSAFIKKEIHQENNLSTDIFSVYGSDGTLLAAFDSKETAIAAIMQSGLKYISLH